MTEIYDYICGFCGKKIGFTDNFIGDEPDETYHWTCFLGLDKKEHKKEEDE